MKDYEKARQIARATNPRAGRTYLKWFTGE